MKEIHMIKAIEEDKKKFIYEEKRNSNGIKAKKGKIKEYDLSFNILVDIYIYIYNTIRIKGSCKGRGIVILIDSGNIHSFIDEGVY